MSACPAMVELLLFMGELNGLDLSLQSIESPHVHSKRGDFQRGECKT